MSVALLQNAAHNPTFHCRGELTRPIIFSFFSGSGLLDLAFEDECYDIAFVNELHPPFLDAYKYSRGYQTADTAYKPNFSDSSIEDLLRDPSTDGLLESYQLARQHNRRVGFIGGPPCPDFSVGGKNQGKLGDKGKLSKTYAKLIANLQPDFFVFENVKGMVSTRKHREFFDSLRRLLARNGYQTRFDVLNALSFEAPQDRERVILVGLRKKTFGDAQQRLKRLDWNEKYEAHKVKSFEWPQSDNFSENSEKEAPEGLPLHLTVQHWFEINNVSDHPNSEHFFKPRAGISKMLEVREGDTSRKSYKRLHRWRYSPTAAYGNNEVHLHPTQARRLSVAEALAIQSLPSTFSLPPDMSLSNMFKTIGNGVPYLMGRAIASAMKEIVLDE